MDLLIGMLMLVAVPILLLFLIPHGLFWATDNILAGESVLKSADPPAWWMVLPLYVLAWAAGWRVAQEITSSVIGWAWVAALVGGCLGGLARFLLVAVPRSLALGVALAMLLPAAGYVLGAWRTRVLVVESWHSLGAPPAEAMSLVGADLDKLTVLSADGQRYTCCTAIGNWEGRTTNNIRLANEVAACSAVGTDWSCPAPHLEVMAPQKHPPETPPAPPPGTNRLYVFADAIRQPAGWYSFHAYGQVALRADGSVWEWRRNEGAGVFDYRPRLLTEYMASRLRNGGLLGALGGGLLLLALSAAVSLGTRLLRWVAAYSGGRKH